MNPESLIAALTAEVRQMRHDINLLIEKSPESVSPWIPPRELARLLGVSSQTITAIEMMDGFVPAAPVQSNEGNELIGNTTAKTPLLMSGGWHDL